MAKVPLHALFGLLLTFSAVSCNSKSESPSEPESAASVASKEEPAKERQPRARDGLRLWRSLLREASRAEMRMGGPFVDFGSADQHKYTQGGWASGWDEREGNQPTRAASHEGKALLNFFLLRSPAEVVVRARSPLGAQKLRVSAGRDRLGAFELSDDWQELRLPTDKLGTGRVRLHLEHDADKPVELDWLWLADTKGLESPTILERTGPVKMGKRLRRSLLAPHNQSYSYYLSVIDGAKLIFDYGAKSPLTFVVRAQTVQGESIELFRATSASSWKTAAVDLAPIAGETVRLELATEGKGEGGAWGEPGIFIKKDEGALAPAETIAKAKKAKNLILVVMDTTRADQFELWSPGNGIYTPKLDAWSKRATSFTRAYNVGNWTKPSMLSIFSGLYPATHTATKPESMVPDEIQLVSEHLQRYGLKTQGFTSNPVVSEKFGFERGWDDFQVYYDDDATGEPMYKRAAKWVAKNGDRPFFLYIQTIDPHTTYSVPSKYWSRYYKGRYKGPFGRRFTRDDQKKINDRVVKPSSNDIEWIQALYHGEISYQDEHVGGFLKRLEALGRLEDTIVVVTNDHGEEIYDHGSFGHGWTLYEEMIRAPLMVHYPPLFPAGTEVRDIVEHVDLMPTLLQAMGLPAMSGIEGTSFLARLHGDLSQEPRYAISMSDNGKRSIHIGDWKLEVTEKSGWKNLFEITSSDAEKRDRQDDAELAGRMCEIYMGEGIAIPGKVERLKGKGLRRKIQAQDANMDAALRKQMEALGYL